MKLKDKVAIITGGAQGIGKAIALTFASEGAKVVVCDIDETLAKETASTVTSTTNSETLSFKSDVRNLEEIEKIVLKTVEKFGKIDILVNNAGITKDNLIIRMTEEEWQDVIDINLKGVFNCSKAVSKFMIKQHSGRIINIASVVGLMGNPGQVNYSASKAGVIAITKTLAKELATKNILVNAIAPGFIKTRMTEKLTEEQKEKLIAFIPIRRLGEPEDIAKVALFLASDDSSYITGQVIVVDGGMYM